MITQKDLRRKTHDSCGYDIATPVDLYFTAGEWQDVDLKLYLEHCSAMSLPAYPQDGVYTPLFLHKWFMMIVPRSSMGMKYGLRLANTVGIIDQDYVGPDNTIKARLCTDVNVTITAGTRILQGILIPFGVFDDEEPPTEVRTGGIGSTGQ